MQVRRHCASILRNWINSGGAAGRHGSSPMLELVIANLLEVVVRLTPSNTSEFLLGDIFEIFDIKKRRFGPRKALVWLVHQLWVCTVSRVPRTIHNAWKACRVRVACSAGLRTPSGVPLDVCVAAITIVPKEVL